MEAVKVKNIQIFGRIEDTLNEDEQRFINQCKISDLKELVSPYLKNNYKYTDNLIEDVIVGLLENSKMTVDILERQF